LLQRLVELLELLLLKLAGPVRYVHQQCSKPR
jgi:hypothetical protein